MIESSLSPSEPVLLPGRPSGRTARSVAGYTLLTALMIVTAPLLVFVPAALLHCAMRNGRRAGWVVGVGAVVLAAGYTAAVQPAGLDAAKLAWTSFAGSVLSIVLPALAAIPLVERGTAFGRVLVFLLAGSIAGLALTEGASRALLDFSPYAAQVAELHHTNAEIVKLYRANGMNEVAAMAERWSTYQTYVLPAGLLCITAVFFVLSLLMLGRLNAWRDHVARRTDVVAERYLFRNFALPEWALFAFVFGGLTPLAHGMLQKVAANVLVVVAFLFVLQGLAIFRFALVGRELSTKVLGWSMLAFLTVTSVAPLLLGVAGLFDPFFDFRHYKKRKDDSHESHSD